MSDLHSVFLEEATDLLSNLEAALLSLENTPEDSSAVEQVFRVMHTLKGNSSMFGFHKMGEFTHHLENIYDLVRSGQVVIDRPLLTLTLECTDLLKAMLEDPALEQAKNLQQYKILKERIGHFGSGHEESLPEVAAIAESKAEESDVKPTYYIFLKPKAEIFRNGTNPLYLLEDLCGMGNSKVVACWENIPPLADMEAESSYLCWHIFLSTDQAADSLREVFMFVEDDCELDIIIWMPEDLIGTPLLEEGLNGLVIPSHALSQEQLQKLIRPQETIEVPESRPEEKVVQAVRKEHAISSIRVASEKLDSLMNMVSELVTTQARLSMLAEQSDDPELLSVAEEIEKVSRRLRDNTFSICLIPIENMLVRFRRLVRDLSSELGKDITFITEGADTELDKTIIESLADPLLHIIRNSIDHGIEEQESRVAKGKPAQGRLLLKAYYSGNSVKIQIKDDGAGIDVEKIRLKAIEKKLISPEAQLSERELLDIIFLPGFSTATAVTDVSGRGVGMDVVRRKIADLRGEIDISSSVGKGTNITISLPLTLSIIDGLLVRIEQTHFVIPLSAVEKCYEVEHSRLVSRFGDLITLDGEQVPFCYLRQALNFDSEAPFHEEVIVVSYEDKKVGLTVDQIVGEYQAVLKPLGRYYQKQDYISGATILGDGTIALVLDTNKTIRELYHHQKQELHKLP